MATPPASESNPRTAHEHDDLPVPADAPLPPLPTSTTADKRKAITLGDKAKIIRILQNTGQSRRALARQLDIPRATMHSIWKNKDEILSRTSNMPQDTLASVKRCRPPQYPELEDRIYAYCIQIKAHEKPASKSLIITKARKLATEMGIVGFSASNGWYAKFLRRRGLRLPDGRRRTTIIPSPPASPSSLPSSHPSRTDHDHLTRPVLSVKDQLAQFAPENIFCALESGFLFASIPNESTINRISHDVRAVASIGNVPRLSFLLSMNATGSHILPMHFIGRERQPACFDLVNIDENITNRYVHHPDGFADGNLFHIWLTQWYENVRSVQTGPWALLIDARSLREALPTFHGVTYVTIGPGMCEAGSNGVVAFVKTRARELLLEKLCRARIADTNLVAAARAMRPGAAGLAYGRSPTILDAIRCMTEATDELDAGRIGWTWAVADVLPEMHRVKLKTLYGVERKSGFEIEEWLTQITRAESGGGRDKNFEHEFGRFDGIDAHGVRRWMEFVEKSEDHWLWRKGSKELRDTVEEILAASKELERNRAAEDEELERNTVQEEGSHSVASRSGMDEDEDVDVEDDRIEMGMNEGVTISGLDVNMTMGHGGGLEEAPSSMDASMEPTSITGGSMMGPSMGLPAIGSEPLTAGPAPPESVRPTSIRPSSRRLAPVRSEAVRPAHMRPTAIRPVPMRPAPIRPAVIRPAPRGPPSLRPSSIRREQIRPVSMVASPMTPVSMGQSSIGPSSVGPSSSMAPSTMGPNSIIPTSPLAPVMMATVGPIPVTMAASSVVASSIASSSVEATRMVACAGVRPSSVDLSSVERSSMGQMMGCTEERREKMEQTAEERARVGQLRTSLEAAEASVKIVQTALADASIKAACNEVIGKLAEALRLAVMDRDQKRANLQQVLQQQPPGS